ncbi:ankyrin repeat domain-containing protein [Luteococcus sp. H138]|uniref:ankyrin repeat domain-containing protein n=1 Tax=unclassified Luteococcus TaxID=2639923 RepID=UPI00313E67B9
MAADEAPTLTDEQLELLNDCFDLARRGDSARLLALVDAGIPVNLADHKGDSLLGLAAYNGHSALVQALLDRGADPNRLNQRGQTALACALFVQDVDSVRSLLAAGADPSAGHMHVWEIVDFFNLDAMRDLLPPKPQPTL